jgi:hypothetical protein
MAALAFSAAFMHRGSRDLRSMSMGYWGIGKLGYNDIRDIRT